MTVESTDDLIMLSALQHFVFCPRQCALIHIEQICAQAICLEEMLSVEIKEGALFYGQTRRREDVSFDKTLRMETEETAKKIHELIASGITPKAEHSAKCKKCSLVELCLPKVSNKAGNYLLKVIEEE